MYTRELSFRRRSDAWDPSDYVPNPQLLLDYLLVVSFPLVLQRLQPKKKNK